MPLVMPHRSDRSRSRLERVIPDPLLPFEIGTMNGRRARESGPRRSGFILKPPACRTTVTGWRRRILETALAACRTELSAIELRRRFSSLRLGLIGLWVLVGSH